MKCPHCVAEEKKSLVYCGGSSITLAYYSPFYDEDGVYHRHDENTINTAYWCSRGHQWSANSKYPCPALNCEWNAHVT